MARNGIEGQTSARASAFSLIILLCFFFSGLAGLIYQVLWLRMIDKVVGSAPFAVETVLSVFMGGLALGSFLSGRTVDRVTSKEKLLVLYGKVELGIGVYALILPLLIYAVKPAYGFAYHSLFDHLWLYRVFSFIGCFLLLITPTTLMGFTLPLLCRFYVENLGHIGTRTGRLYGINTIGGAAGAILCGFFLIARFGVWGTIFTAAGINILIGLLCIGFNRIEKKSPSRTIADRRPEPPSLVYHEAAWILPASLLIFGVSGFCAMAYEVFWTRLLGLIIGPTTFSFSLVVATFIIGLAIGNILFGQIADRIQKTFGLLVLTQWGAACFVLLVSQFLGNSQFFFSKLLYSFHSDPGAKLFVQGSVLFIVLLCPTILLGATFPLIGRIYTRSLPAIGKSIGTAYAINTVGAILGSIAAGFILIPLVGKETGLRLTAGLQMAASLAAMGCLAYRAQKKIHTITAGAIALFLAAVLINFFPSWERTLLSRGWYRQSQSLEQDFDATSWTKALWEGTSLLSRYVTNSQVVFYGDGVGGFTTVVKRVSPNGTDNLTLYNSGKKEANSHTSRLIQALPAHIPLLFHPNPQKVMILGLASGMTAGEALLYPVEQLDVLEINDQVVKAAELFAPCNNSCLTHPNTRIILQDGRNHLELTDEKYDVIISSPADPWVAGMANLFTLDYFKTVKRRLEGNGIFVQWISAYDMDWASFSMVGRSFAAVFPESLLINTNNSSDLLLVGFSEKRNLDLKTAEAHMVYANASQNITLRNPGVIFDLIVTEDLPGFFGTGPYHTDNRPYLEFAAPKNLDRNDALLAEKLKTPFRLSGETQAVLGTNASIDSSLDRLELMQATSSPPFLDVDLDHASTAQMARYQNILQDYCTCEDVSKYSIFPSIEFQRACAQIQVEKIEAHLTRHPRDGQAYDRLALASKVTGDISQEMTALQKMISLAFRYDTAHMELGKALTSLHRYDEAMTHFSEVLTLQPDSAEAHNNIANVLALQGKTSEAMAHYSRALQLDPAQAETHLNVGRLLLEQGKPGDALVHFKQALKVDPDNADLHQSMGLLLGAQGELAAAAGHFLKAIRLDPTHFLANKNLGVTLLQQGKVEEAERRFLKAQEIEPDDLEIHRVLGRIYENQERYQDAADQYFEALRLDPDSAENHDNLGVALAQMGQLKEAIEQFTKALDIDDSFMTARNHLEIARNELVKSW